MTAVLTAADVVADLIGGHRYTFADEYDLQAGVAAVLTAAHVPFTAEHRLTARDRLDFLVGRVAVEVKIAGSTPTVARQLRRYADHPDIDAVVLVTARHAHRQMSALAVGVPVHVVLVGAL